MPSDIFAKIDGIKGESLDDKHKDEVELLSFSLGVLNGGSLRHGSGGGDGKASFQDASFTHNVDKASSALWQACATGTHIKEVTIVSRKAGKGQQDFLIIKLTDVIVSSVQDANGGNGPTEEVGLSYAKIGFEYKPQRADGQLDAGMIFKYDVKAQKEE
jgi:type VI secretion system secreted protein Hcp